jgi:hypothetical protein
MSYYSKANQRLPLFNYGKNKEESIMITKYIDEMNKDISHPNNIKENSNEEEQQTTKSHNYNTRSTNKVKTHKLHMIEDDKLFGAVEYEKCVNKALKEALNENEKVSLISPFF